MKRFVDSFKRAHLKLEEERTTKEILEIFLACYRATSNPNTDENLSAESLVNHKVRLHIDVIQPTINHSLKWNTVMEEQFNSHHRAVKHRYVQGHRVFAED